MDAKKCDICGKFYLPYNTQCDADDMSDATCPCCMNKFLDLFYDIQKRTKEELSKRIIPKSCSMCLYGDSLPNEDPCKSCEDFSNFIF